MAKLTYIGHVRRGHVVIDGQSYPVAQGETCEVPDESVQDLLDTGSWSEPAKRARKTAKKETVE